MNTKQNNPDTAETPSDVANETANPSAAPETRAAAPSSKADEAPDDAETDTSRNKKAKDPRHSKAAGRGERSQRQSAGSNNKAGTRPAMRERLLARFVTPSIPLDRDLLPEALLGPLDAAALGRADVLPSSFSATMAAIAAVAGPHLEFAECADSRLGEKLGTGTSLRIVMVGVPHAGPIVPGHIMAAVYAVENDLVADHEQSVHRIASLRRAAAERRRLHAQATHAAAVLRIAPPPQLPEDLPVHAAARPRIVLNEATRSDVLEAAAGGSGVMVIDGRWVKSMTVGLNRDKETAVLLGALALGHAVPVVHPDGRTEMRALPACVIGALTPECSLFLDRVGRDQLPATLFAPAAAAPLGGDDAPLVALMRRVRSMTVEPVVLHLAAKARQTLVAACAGWSAIEARSAAPLSYFVAGLPDLARRLASLLHLLECAASDGGAPAEIPIATVKNSVAIVDRFVLPTARVVLAPVACEEVERDARVMISHLRLHTSLDVAIARRPWMRAWQNRMPLPRFEAALNLLLREQLLTPTQGEDGGRWYAAASELHDA